MASLAAGADPLEQLHGFEVVVHAAGLSLLARGLAEVLDGDREVADGVALAGVEGFWGQGEDGWRLAGAPR